jgi:glycosyltransferase involved in cell wall biosynthesis
LPYIKKTKKTIVREAVHLEYHKNKSKIKRLFPKKVDVFILSSEENKKSYTNFFKGIKSKINIVKIYNPLTIIPKTIDNISNKNIVSVGRYDTHKGYDYLIRAFAIVNQKHSDWNLRIVGDGYYKEKMKQLITELDLNGTVLLVPSTKDIVEELNKSSIYVMSSRFEGYANALVEAMACGLSCISYNWLMGVEEIIKNNKNGIVVKLTDRYNYFRTLDIVDKDIKSLANEIIKVIEDKKLRENFKKESVKIIESRDKDIVISKWLDLIEEKI